MTGLGVVTIAHGRHDHLRAQHESLARGGRLPELYVVVAIDDPGLADWPAYDGLPAHVLPIDPHPDGLPLAAARNAGLDFAASAGCEVLVGLDVDCLAGPALLSGYERAVREQPRTVWSGPVTYLGPRPSDGYPLDRLTELDDPHPARPAPAPGELRVGADPDLFWSLSFAMSAVTWQVSGRFCEQYVGYGGEDTDFGRGLDARGIPLGWTGSARAYHQHHPIERPPVRHLDDILRNGALFQRRWGEWPMAGWMREFERLGLVVRRGDAWVRA